MDITTYIFLFFSEEMLFRGKYNSKQVKLYYDLFTD